MQLFSSTVTVASEYCIVTFMYTIQGLVTYAFVYLFVLNLEFINKSCYHVFRVSCPFIITVVQSNEIRRAQVFLSDPYLQKLYLVI